MENENKPPKTEVKVLTAEQQMELIKKVTTLSAWSIKTIDEIKEILSGWRVKLRDANNINHAQQLSNAITILAEVETHLI